MNDNERISNLEAKMEELLGKVDNVTAELLIIKLQQQNWKGIMVGAILVLSSIGGFINFIKQITEFFISK
jgi:uncharacterized membrane protein YqhA